MKSPSLPFIDVSGANEQVARLQLVFEKIHPRFIKWLRRAKIEDNSIRLTYSINTPTTHWLEKEIAPLLKKTACPQKIEAEFIRPGDLHPKAREFLATLKKRLEDSPNDFRRLGDEYRSALFYLAQYGFVRIQYENEVL